MRQARDESIETLYLNGVGNVDVQESLKQLKLKFRPDDIHQKHTSKILSKILIAYNDADYHLP
jgi:hypothetical protein